MNDLGSKLVAHCGAHKVTREELREIPIPEGTRTHQPLAHYEIIEVLEEALSFRYLKVVRDEYAISQDGMKMFGVMDLNSEFNGGRFSIGLRNSNDKSMRLALTAGVRVFVCDNMAFSGDFLHYCINTPGTWNSKDSISIAVDRIHRGFEPLKEKIQAMREQVLSEDEVKLIIYQAFLDKSIRGIPKFLMPMVHDLYFHPKHEAFVPRNLWSLSNAFTSSFKKLAPIKQFEVTARLGTFLTDVQTNLKEKLELHLKLKREEREQQRQELEAMQEMNGGQIPPPQFYQPPQPFQAVNEFQNEDFDMDDVAEDPFEEEIFDEYFDEEESIEEIDEATEQIIEKYEQMAA